MTPPAWKRFGEIDPFSAMTVFAGAYGAWFLAEDFGLLLVGSANGATFSRTSIDWQTAAIDVFMRGIALAWLLYAIPRTLGSAARRTIFGDFRWTQLGWAILALIATFAGDGILQMLLTALHAPHVRGQILGMLLASGFQPATFVVMANGVLVSPMVEEITMRGLLFRAIYARGNFWVAVIVSSLAFAAGHHDRANFVIFFFDGIVLALLYAKTRSLWASYAAHAAINFFIFVWVAVAALRR